MASKRYSDKELHVFLWIFIPYTLGMNLILFGECVYASFRNMAIALGLSSVYLFFIYIIFGMVAVLIQKRFPANNELFRRIALMLPVFYSMNILLVSGIYVYYKNLISFSCEPLSTNFFWAYAYGCLCSTIITFLNEAVVNWEKWKTSVTEMDQLRNSYRKTKLLGLKGQINPHFLFNCFNSLSSLINDDEEKAEQFLDEMTKVHRYMLRGDDEQLVPVSEEIRFAKSYLFLTTVRFGGAIQCAINTDGSPEQKCLPPLSLQAILENIIYTNAASKSNPLKLSITGYEDSLVIKNQVQSKPGNDENDFADGLDNLIMKYRLLHVTEVVVEENANERTIILPLLSKEEVRT